MQQWGFPVNSYIECGSGVEFLKKYYKKAESLRDKLLYEPKEVGAQDAADFLKRYSKKGKKWLIK